MALTIVDVGRAALAKAIKDQNVVLAVGGGSGTWVSAETTPDLEGDETTLVDPIAMVRPTIKDYVEEDAFGTIEAPDGSKWTIVPGPTKFLYLSYVLGYTDGPDEILKELGLYLGPTFSGSVGGGQNYIEWADVTSPGSLLALERFLALERAGVRQTISKILTF